MCDKGEIRTLDLRVMNPPLSPAELPCPELLIGDSIEDIQEKIKGKQKQLSEKESCF